MRLFNGNVSYVNLTLVASIKKAGKRVLFMDTNGIQIAESDEPHSMERELTLRGFVPALPDATATVFIVNDNKAYSENVPILAWQIHEGVADYYAMPVMFDEHNSSNEIVMIKQPDGSYFYPPRENWHANLNAAKAAAIAIVKGS